MDTDVDEFVPSHEGSAAARENSVGKTQVDLAGSTPASQEFAAAKAVAAANQPLERATLSKQRLLIPWVRTGMSRIGQTGCADKRPAASSRAKSSASVMFGQHWGHDKYHQVQGIPFRAQKMTREHVPVNDPDPQYPPGFNPAVRVNSTLDFPGLASESINRHLPVPNLGSSTSAAGQLSFSLATANSNEAPLPPTLPIQTPGPPNELPDPVTRMPPGLKVSCQAALTAPLPSHTHTASPEPDSHEQISNDTQEAAHSVESQRPGSSNQQPKQQGWDLHSNHQAPQQSGWDIDSDSEPHAAWTPFGNNQHSRGTHSQQANEPISSPQSGWRPDEYQGTDAKPTDSFTPSRFHKLQQQRMPSTHQYSPEPLAMSPIRVRKGETKPQQKTPTHAGGWNPDIFQGQTSPVRVGGWNPHKYQGTGVADYNGAAASTVEETRQHPSVGHDDSLHSLLSYAFPTAFRPHCTSETGGLPSAHTLAEQPDPNVDDTLKRMYMQCHASCRATSRQNQELGAKPDGNPHAAAPLSNQKAGQMQPQSWDDRSSQSKPEALSPFPGGFGMRPSHHARNSEGIYAQLPIHQSPSSPSEKDSHHSISGLQVTNGSAYDHPSGYDKHHQRHLLNRQHSQGSDQLEGEVPMWGDSEGDGAEWGDSQGPDQLEGEVPLWGDSEGEVPLWGDSEGDGAEWGDSEGPDQLEGEVPLSGYSEGGEPEGAAPERGDDQGADPEGVGPQGADPEGGVPGYTTPVAQDYTPDLLQYLQQETKELEWVTARPKRDKRRPATVAQEPLALLDCYCAEGKILRSHIDDRCLSYMKSLHPDIQCQALTQFANHKSKEVLSNPPAYFMSLLKGLQSGAHIPPSMWTKKQTQRVLTVPRSAVATAVSPEAAQKLAELYSQGVLEPTLLDQHCLGLLARLPQNAQLVALTCMSENINSAVDKRDYVSQLLKLMLLRANDFNLKLDPCSFCYDAKLAMCWRVLTKQEKWEWRNRFAKGKQIKLADLSRPRQVLAQQLHRDNPKHPTAAAAVWKRTDAATKDALLLSADQTGEAIKLVPDEQPNPKKPEQPNPKAAETEFHESDFPPLGQIAYPQRDPSWGKPMPSRNGISQGAGVPSSDVPSSGVPLSGVPSSRVSSSGIPSNGVPSDRGPSEGVPSNGVSSSAADQIGEAIKLLPDEQPNPKAAEPEFHESDFPPLGMTAHLQHGPGCSKPMPSGNSSLHGAGIPSRGALSRAAGEHGTGSTKPMFVPSMPAILVPQPRPSNPSGELHSARSGDCHNAMKGTQSLCTVCFETKPLCMCVPCGHIAVCKPCSQAVLKQTSVCPVCQQAIQSMQELFFA